MDAAHALRPVLTALLCHARFCPQSLPQFKGLKQEQMENILDRFDAREELMQGDTILNQGDVVRAAAAAAREQAGRRRRSGRAAWRGLRARSAISEGAPVQQNLPSADSPPLPIPARLH